MNNAKRTLGKAKATQPTYFQNVRMTFRQQPKGKGTRWNTQTRLFTAIGTKKDIKDKMAEKFAYIKNQIEENSPTNSKDFQMEMVGERTLVKGKSGYMMKKMKHFVYELSGDEPQEWDTKTGRCVFDYLIYKYKDLKGFIKMMNYEYLADILSGTELVDNDPLTQGVSITQLKKFCDRFGVRMYAWDCDDNLLEYHNPSKINKNATPIVFRIYNNHFYPIENADERKRKIGIASHLDSDGINVNKIKSKDIVIMEETSVGEKEPKNVIAPPIPLDEDGNERNYTCEEANRFAFENILSRNKLPFPINKKNLYFSEGRINNLTIDKDIIMTSPVCEPVKKYLEDNSRTYQGEQPVALLYEIWEDVYDDTITNNEMRSSPNPSVAKLLQQEGIKYRTHYGATRDLTEYLQLEEKYDDETIITTEPIVLPVKKGKGQQTLLPNAPKTKKVKTTKKKLVSSERVIDRMLRTGEAVSCDINKCYASLLVSPKDNWIVYDFLDEVENYVDEDYYTDDTELPLGLFFAETNDLTLLHQTNWYSNKILDMAKNEGIEFKIKYQLRDRLKFNTETQENAEYFHPVLTEIIERCGDNTDLRKLVINQITGCLGKTMGTRLQVHLTNNAEEVWEKFMLPNAEKNQDVFIQPINHQDKELWIYGHTEITEWTDYNLPMYIQILDWSNMMLYDMAKKMGGEIIFRKTDCVVCVGGKAVPEIIETEDITNSWGEYRNETADKAMNLNYQTQMRTGRHLAEPPINDLWNNYNNNDSSDWEKILKIAIEKGGLLIMGRAGTGKSYITGQGVEKELLTDDKKLRLAFTNRASRNINGTTIHKALAINKEGKTNNKSLASFKKTDVIVVDEISMINADLWKLLYQLKKTSQATFILMGDKRQCRPIEAERIDEDCFNYFNHPVVKYLVNSNRLELSVRKRYDVELWDYLEDFYENGITGSQIPTKKVSLDEIYTSKNICYFNKTRDFINDLVMNKHRKETDNMFLDYERKDDKDKAKAAYIYIGLPVMAVVNKVDLGIINSEEFIVSEWNDEVITMRREESDEEIEINTDEFHKYFVVNYCSTTHKSQGATITAPIIIWDWNKMKYNREVGYTALSRAKTIKQLCFGIAP
jgi:hypothetical protein